jgi:disulfide bond formation protein DsbB
MQGGRLELTMAWLCASLALVASIHFSEGRHWTPCFLCWYQRICMWPLVPILAVALWKDRREIIPCLLPQVVLGLLLAVYQVVIQEWVGSEPLGLCPAGPDCAVKVDLGLGPVSIPMMSLAAFAATLVLLIRSWHPARRAGIER